MRVLVTGSSGFLGKPTVTALLACGHDVRALVRPATAVERLPWANEVELFRADLRGGEDLDAALEDVDVVVHLATQMVGDDASIFAGSVAGTERLMDALKRKPPRRLVLISSFSVYDWTQVRGSLDEASPVLSRPYGAGGYASAKLWQERLAERAAKEQGFELVVLRPGFVWGPGNEDLACIGQRLGPLQFVFGPARELPLTFVENCADCVRTATTSERAAGQTFNVVDGQGVSAWRYAEARRRHAGGVRVPLPWLAARAGVGLVNLASRLLFRGRGKLPSMFVPVRFDLRFRPARVSTKKLEGLLAWSPPLGFEACVERTWPRGARPSAPAIETA